MTREGLQKAYEHFRDAYGGVGIELRGRALPPWMRRWAEENGVEVVDMPNAPLGKVAIYHRVAGRGLAEAP